MECEHKFGIKRRNDAEFYCPVCRSIIYKNELNENLKRGEGWWVPPVPREKNEK